MRKKNDETTTTQQTKDADVEKDMQRAVKSAHGHKDPTLRGTQTPPSDLSRPRTASRIIAQETYPEVSMPNSARNFAESLAFKLPSGPSRRMSMTPSPRTTTTRLTLHANHSTPGVVSEGPRNPKRSMTTPIEPLPTVIKKEEKPVETIARSRLKRHRLLHVRNPICANQNLVPGGHSSRGNSQNHRSQTLTQQMLHNHRHSQKSLLRVPYRQYLPRMGRDSIATQSLWTRQEACKMVRELSPPRA